MKQLEYCCQGHFSRLLGGLFVGDSGKGASAALDAWAGFFGVLFKDSAGTGVGTYDVGSAKSPRGGLRPFLYGLASGGLRLCLKNPPGA